MLVDFFLKIRTLNNYELNAVNDEAYTPHEHVLLLLPKISVKFLQGGHPKRGRSQAHGSKYRACQLYNNLSMLFLFPEKDLSLIHI